MIATLKRVLGRGPRPTEFRECRNCGTTVEGPAGGCPACDSREIACYHL